MHLEISISMHFNHWSPWSHWSLSCFFFLNILENRLDSSQKHRHCRRSESIALFSTKDEPAVVSNFFHTSTGGIPWHPVASGHGDVEKM